MTSLPFTRLFSMPAFEGLRIIRLYGTKHPKAEIDEIIQMIHKAEADAASYDMEAALFLNERVSRAAPCEGMEFYRECLAEVLLIELPEWAKLVTLGRGRFIKRLRADEFRDIRSLFRQARLLDDPPDMADIAWWDKLQAHVRTEDDAEKMQRARIAEQLSLRREAALLKRAGIEKEPVWMAIEDNTAGYDVLSYTVGQYGLLNKLIEVKSTIASPLRFYLTRNEWEQALVFGKAFLFHIWNLGANPPTLFEKTVAQISPHIPHDNEKGEWKTAVIPVDV